MMKVRGTASHCFTLLELLTVLAIAGVVMALTVPAFTRMLSGNKVDEMAGRLKLGLEQAQSIAATNNRYVALLLPGGSDTDVTDADARRYRLGGFRPAFVNRNGSSYTFDRWVDDHNWQNAPDEAVLTRILNTIADLPQISSEVSTRDEAEIPGASGKIGIVGYAANTTDAFGSSGLMELASNPIGTATSPVAVVFNPRGGIMNGSDLYFVVAAAKINGSNVDYPARDSRGPVDYRLLMVHQYTGRVEFR